MNMRHLVIERLSVMIGQSDGIGIESYFDCPLEDYITDSSQLTDLYDQQLLEIFEVNVSC